jgi:hypothetical protein
VAFPEDELTGLRLGFLSQPDPPVIEETERDENEGSYRIFHEVFS